MNVPERVGVKRTVSESPGMMCGIIVFPQPLHPGHTVGEALELDAMPMHRSGLVRLVHDRDRDALLRA